MEKYVATILYRIARSGTCNVPLKAHTVTKSFHKPCNQQDYSYLNL